MSLRQSYNYFMVFSISRALRGELFNEDEILVIKKFMRMALTEAEKMDSGKVICMNSGS